jgi:hypothetical protein
MTKHFVSVLALIAFGTVAEAGTITIEVGEDNGNVVFTGQGDLDLAQGSLTATASPFLGVSLSVFDQFIGVEEPIFFGTPVPLDSYEFTGATFSALTSNTAFFLPIGDSFGLDWSSGALSVLVDTGYQSGDSIDFTWTVTGTTVADLGVSFGTIATFGGNEVKVVEGNINGGGNGDTTVIPLPASGLLLLAGLPLGLVLRRANRT